MVQYINKSALVAEIESKIKYAQNLGDNAINGSMQQFYDGMKQGCVDILSFINTLEVKEVDLNEEINNYFNRISHFGKIHLTPEYDNIKVSTMTIDGFASIAKHFFELGLKAQKGE